MAVASTIKGCVWVNEGALFGVIRKKSETGSSCRSRTTLAMEFKREQVSLSVQGYDGLQDQIS